MKFTIIGAGLFGSICAYELSKFGYDITVIDKRNHIGGNCFTENINGIEVHKYGPHIFHTKNEKVWKYIKKFTKFNNYVHKVFTNFQSKIYSLPFNNLTYYQVFGNDFSIPLTEEQKNILIEMFIRNYSEKHWQRKLEDIPYLPLSRLPFKYTLNNDYFEEQFQGIPIGGYTKIFEKLLKKSNIILNKNFKLTNFNENVIFTGCIDELFDYRFGKLDYRYLKFENEYLSEIDNFQYNAVNNYPEKEFPFIRITEHKHFEFNKCKGTLITREYPSNEGEPCYPINDDKNNELYIKYKEFAQKNFPNIKFGGRLGFYKYLDMDKTIEEAINFCKDIKNE